MQMSQRKFWGKDGIFTNPRGEIVKLRGPFYAPSSALMEFWHLEKDADSRKHNLRAHIDGSQQFLSGKAGTKHSGNQTSGSPYISQSFKAAVKFPRAVRLQATAQNQFFQLQLPKKRHGRAAWKQEQAQGFASPGSSLPWWPGKRNPLQG